MEYSFFHFSVFPFHRDRPAAIPVHVKHMADTSNFDDFEELNDQKKSKSLIGTSHNNIGHPIIKWDDTKRVSSQSD